MIEKVNIYVWQNTLERIYSILRNICQPVSDFNCIVAY